MKIHSLVYNKKVVGFRFRFQNLGYAYDITFEQFKLYFDDININIFRSFISNCGDMKLTEVGEVLLTEDEQHFKYKVISLEGNDSPVAWLNVLVHLDIHIDAGSKYIYRPSGAPEFNVGDMCTLEDIDLQSGRAIVKSENCNEYLVGIRDLKKC